MALLLEEFLCPESPSPYVDIMRPLAPNMIVMRLSNDDVMSDLLRYSGNAVEKNIA